MQSQFRTPVPRVVYFILPPVMVHLSDFTAHKKKYLYSVVFLVLLYIVACLLVYWLSSSFFFIEDKT